MLTFVARPYLIPSESMEPTLHGCPGCVGDRIMVAKVTYDFARLTEGATEVKCSEFGDQIIAHMD